MEERKKSKNTPQNFTWARKKRSSGINRNNIKGDTSLMKTTNSVLDIVEFEVLTDKSYSPTELK